MLLPLAWLNAKRGFVDQRLIVVAILADLVFCFFNFMPKGKAKCFAGNVGSVGAAFIGHGDTHPLAPQLVGDGGVVLGHYEEYLYDDSGALEETVDMVPDGNVLNVPAGQRRSLKSLKSGTVLLEFKDGKWEMMGNGI